MPSNAFYLPIRTISEANARDHWSVRQRRARDQRTTAMLLAGNALPFSIRRADGPGLIVTLTRVSPRGLDDDNLAAALKAVRDGIAVALQTDDGPRGRVTWHYAQARGDPCVRVEVEVAT